MILQEILSQVTVQQIVLVLYGVLTAVVFIFGSDLLNRYYQADKQTRGDAAHMTFFAIGAGVLGYGFYMVTEIYNLYFAINGSTWIFPLQILVDMLIVSAIAFTVENFVFSKQRFFKIGKFNIGVITIVAAITILYLLGILITTIASPGLITIDITNIVFIPAEIVFGIFAIVSFLGIVQVLFIRLSPERSIKKKIFLGFFSGAIALAGSMIGVFTRGSYSWTYILGTVVEICGWVFFRAFFMSIPAYSELDWKDGLIELNVIMADTGLSLYSRKFQKITAESLKGDLEVTTVIPEAQRPDSDLTGGAMIGIQGLLSEIAGTKGKLKNVQIGEKTLTFNQGENTLVLLLTDSDLGVYHSILYRLARAIEEANPNLAKFNGDTRTLNIEPTVDKFFGAAPVKRAEKEEEE